MFIYTGEILILVIEKLKKLGLSGYEAQAYISLLKLGDAEANELATRAKIPMGRIYNVLSSLEEFHLIRAQDTRPRKYVCVEPAAALERLLKNKREEFTRASIEMDELASELASELTVIKPNKSAKTFWTVAIGDNSLDLFRECIISANKEVLFFMASQKTSERLKQKIKIEKLPGILSAIHDVLKKGVDVKAILNEEVDFSEVERSSSIKNLMMHMGKGFYCRMAVIPATPFHIVDRENVLLEVLNPLAPDDLFALINIRDSKLAEELREKFFTIWEKAEPYTGKICIEK